MVKVIVSIHVGLQCIWSGLLDFSLLTSMHQPTMLPQAAWNYYDNRQSTADSFSKAEQESWNAEKKKKSPAAEQK